MLHGRQEHGHCLCLHVSQAVRPYCKLKWRDWLAATNLNSENAHVSHKLELSLMKQSIGCLGVVGESWKL